MTVNYMQAAATAKGGSFIKLLFRWRGSVWKLVWKELTIYLFVYFNLSVLYRFFLKGNVLGTTFEIIVRHCRSLFSQTEPVISFAMGFYVAQIADRWWRIFMTIPWPDSFGLHLCGLLRTRTGEKYTEVDRTVRRTIMRYLILTYVLVFRDISERLRRRFPTYNHLVPALMTEAEKTKLENEDIKRAYWLPIEWAIQHLRKCYYRGQLEEYHFATLCETILRYREMMHSILSFDWINVPLVYTQEERTWINDFVVPLYAIFEFVFFVGWLKVAQVMLNPFGMDEDDFEIDGLVERNLQVGYSYVDTMFDRLPPLVYVDVTALPHTKGHNRPQPSPGGKNSSHPGEAPDAIIMTGAEIAHVYVPRAEQRIISKEDLEKIRKLLGPTFGSRYASRNEGSLIEEVPQFAIENREKMLPNTDAQIAQVTQMEDSHQKTRQNVTNTAARTSKTLVRPAIAAKNLSEEKTRKGSSKRKTSASIQQKSFSKLDRTQDASEGKPLTPANKIITIQAQRTQDSTREKAERAMKKLKSAPTSAVISAPSTAVSSLKTPTVTPYSSLSRSKVEEATAPMPTKDKVKGKVDVVKKQTAGSSSGEKGSRKKISIKTKRKEKGGVKTKSEASPLLKSDTKTDSSIMPEKTAVEQIVVSPASAEPIKQKAMQKEVSKQAQFASQYAKSDSTSKSQFARSETPKFDFSTNPDLKKDEKKEQKKVRTYSQVKKK